MIPPSALKYGETDLQVSGKRIFFTIILNQIFSLDILLVSTCFMTNIASSSLFLPCFLLKVYLYFANSSVNFRRWLLSFARNATGI